MSDEPVRVLRDVQLMGLMWDTTGNPMHEVVQVSLTVDEFKLVISALHEIDVTYSTPTDAVALAEKLEALRPGIEWWNRE